MCKNLFILSSLFLFSSTGLFAQNKSVYTPISIAKCEAKQTSPVSGYLLCPGVGGYSLEVLDDDSRMSINIISPDNQSFELDLWGYFRSFSYVGERAEWRMSGKKPIAIIIRYNVANPGDDDDKKLSYLMVAKVTKQSSCITNIVKPGKNQNLNARKLADQASSKPCQAIPE